MILSYCPYTNKGACAIWYNLLKNGDGDYRTRHAGCPVLSGTKWGIPLISFLALFISFAYHLSKEFEKYFINIIHKMYG